MSGAERSSGRQLPWSTQRFIRPVRRSEEMSTKTLVNEYISDPSELRLRDAEEAGGKGANMGELVAAGLPVPPGFVLMRSSHLALMRAGGIDTRHEIHSVDVTDSLGGD